MYSGIGAIDGIDCEYMQNYLYHLYHLYPLYKCEIADGMTPL